MTCAHLKAQQLKKQLVRLGDIHECCPSYENILEVDAGGVVGCVKGFMALKSAHLMAPCRLRHLQWLGIWQSGLFPIS